MVYALIAYSALEKQHPDQNFQGGPNFSKKHPDQNFHGGPNFSKISVRADQNFQRKIWSRTKFFRTKIPVTVLYIESDCCLRLVPSKSTHARDKANEYPPSCTSFILYEIGPEIDSARLLALRNKVCCYQLSSLHINVRYRSGSFVNIAGRPGPISYLYCC